MIERSNHLVDLIEFALHGTQEKIDIATSELQEAYQQFDTINDFLNIAQNCEESIVRQFAAISIRRMLIIHDLDQEQIELIKVALLSLIENDPILQNKKAFFEAAIFLQSKLYNPWEELYNMAHNLLSDNESLNLGLQVWVSITKITPEIILLHYFEDLMNCIIATFELQNVDIIINSINLFSELTNVVDVGLFEPYGNLPQLLYDESTAAVKDRPNIKEASVIFQCICDQLTKENPIESFISEAEAFIDLALQLTVSDLDPEILSTCQPLMIIAPQFAPENVESQLPIFLQSELSLAVQLTSADREYTLCDIEFLKDFILSLVINIESSSGVVQGLLTFATNSISSDDPVSLQVALIAMSSITGEASEDFFEAEGENIGDIVLFSLTSAEDHFIFDACCEFLLSASEQCPQLYEQYYDKVVSALFSKIYQEPRALQTLDKVIYRSDQPPSDYIELLSELSSLFEDCSPEQYSSIISCMTSVIVNVTEINEEIYASMRTILVDLLSSDKSDSFTQSKVFSCFGQLSKISPLSIQQDAPELLNQMIECIQNNREDPAFNESIAECIQNLVKVIPSFIQPHLQSIVPSFMELLSYETEPDPENEGENNENQAEEEGNENDDGEESDLPILMQCSILKCLAELVTDLPSDMAEIIPNIVEAACHFLEHSSCDLQSSAAKSIILMNDGLQTATYDTSHLISVIIKKIFKSPNTNVICELFYALGTLIGSSTFESFSEKRLGQIMNLFESSFNGTLEAVYSGPKVLDQDVLNPLFFSLRMFILTLGNNIESNSLSDHFISFLCPHLDSKKNMVKAYVANIYATMFFVAPSLQQIGASARDICFRTMTKSNESVNNIIISTLNYIINTDSGLIGQKQMNSLKNQCNEIIQNREELNSFLVGTAITTWCSISSAFQLELSEDDLNVILSLLPPVVDDDDIPFTSQFIVYANQKWPELTSPHIQRIAVNVFASGAWCLRIVPSEVMCYLAPIVASIDNEQLQIYVNFVQHYVFQIESNLSKFSS